MCPFIQVTGVAPYLRDTLSARPLTAIYASCSDSLSFTCPLLCTDLCVYLVLCNFIKHVVSRAHHHSKKTEEFDHHKHVLCNPFVTTSTLLQLPLPPPLSLSYDTY